MKVTVNDATIKIIGSNIQSCINKGSDPLLLKKVRMAIDSPLTLELRKVSIPVYFKIKRSFYEI